MSTFLKHPIRANLACLPGIVALATSALLTPAVHADNHALIMWIGDYGSTESDLPGIDLDAQMARKMALNMGVPSNNIVEISNRSATKEAVGQALSGLTNRIKEDDKVFIYYSGHGLQVNGMNGAKCTEGLVTADRQIFEDSRLQDALKIIGQKASQVVMMNDSCFSGGAATKSINQVSNMKAKFWPQNQISGNSTVRDDHTCGEYANKMSRNLVQVAASAKAPQVLYIAASAANEVSHATSQGSLGTLAWSTCMNGADLNRSGVIDGAELRACSQKFIDQRNGRQTITLVGNERLPLFFNTTGSTEPVSPLRTLEDIRAARNSIQAVSLNVSKSTMRIGQDELDFTVNTSVAGYLYVLHVGSDGKTFDLLYPNKSDNNNYIAAGSHKFPRASWRVRAMGPAGQSALLAIVSPTQKDLSNDMSPAGQFKSATATSDNAKNLVSAMIGVEGGGGRFGVSEIAVIRETN